LIYCKYFMNKNYFNVHLRTFMRRLLSLFSSPNCVTELDFYTAVTYKNVS
jgi:hypothetical protein